MKKWMMILRESDNVTFLWNEEHCLKITPGVDTTWHHPFGEIPEIEQAQLNLACFSGRSRVFTIKGRGRFRVLARGTFPE